MKPKHILAAVLSAIVFGTAAVTVYYNIMLTDIKVYYNGKRIGAYSINGRILIMMKDLVTDGITCSYDNDKRLTSISVEGLENK